jgi:hypothetical protein
MVAGIKIIAAAGLIVSLALALINVYLAGIALIIFIVLVMSLAIMRDSRFLPNVGVTLRDDAKGVVLVNRGSAPAYHIHLALVPLNIEFDVPSLAVDARYDHPLSDMISEAKAVITWENEQGEKFSHTARLSPLGSDEDEILKPMFPLFRWK